MRGTAPGRWRLRPARKASRPSPSRAGRYGLTRRTKNGPALARRRLSRQNRRRGSFLRIRNEELGVRNFLCRGVAAFFVGADNICHRAGEGTGPYNKTGNVPARSPTPGQLPARGAASLGADGPSTAHGRQQAGLSRVGSRSAGSRGSQAPGLDGRGFSRTMGP